jgi:hypothetical protein
MVDLLNDFAVAAESEKHLQCYRGLIRRARPYTLDDDATALITELASGPTINDKLATYRILARLPFDVIWMELNYDARFKARVALGTSVGEKPKDTPDSMGWIMERITEKVWRATTVIRYSEKSATESGRTVDTFGCTHVISTEGPLEFRSFARDPVLRDAVRQVNQNEPGRKTSIIAAVGWGFGETFQPQLRPQAEIDGGENNRLGDNSYNLSLPRHLDGANAVDLPPSWEPILERVSKGVPKIKHERAIKHMMESAMELQGDLRFLCAALATINEVPITFADVRPQGSRRIGGHIRPYMVNRVVTIAIPKKRGRLNKVMKMLRLAEVRMRRHEVGGHWKTVYSGPGRTVVERRWINDYERGDASLGFVRQEREVVEGK